jgi:tellurite resistance protein TehA-like permease
VEFNAGGRYMLVGMFAIALLLVAGTSFAAWQRRILWPVWLVGIVLMNLLSAWNIDTVLNPRYAPNWQTFHFPPGEER